MRTEYVTICGFLFLSQSFFYLHLGRSGSRNDCWALVMISRLSKYLSRVSYSTGPLRVGNIGVPNRSNLETTWLGDLDSPTLISERLPAACSVRPAIGAVTAFSTYFLHLPWLPTGPQH